MPRFLEGHLNAAGYSFGIVVSRFNNFVTERLLDGAIDALVRHGADPEAIAVYRVPGAFELPFIARRVARSGKHDAVVALGAVIRGSTPHFDVIAAEVTKGLAQASLDTDRPISFGVLTCDTIEQAVERAGTKTGNKGAEAALGALEMADLLRRIEPVLTRGGTAEGSREAPASRAEAG
ncbi:MAG: 6,7-dimethyl-8-ribityllumazine synthase [Deltaproteobacteria bacterium]|nr:6,7-dimethyl-8-ribityllumazine synthase [Deltaproteobacteria bacterium]